VENRISRFRRGRCEIRLDVNSQAHRGKIALELVLFRTDHPRITSAADKQFSQGRGAGMNPLPRVVLPQ
jgi:hypothetical protein